MVFIETRVFTKYLLNYLSDEEYRALQNYLLMHPDSGDVIPGAGGLRKIRWIIKGRGKRKGIRIIYFRKVNKQQIYLLTIYAKNEMKDITSDQKKLLRQLIED